MSISDKLRPKDIGLAVGILIVFVVAMLLVLNFYRNEGEKRSASIANINDKNPNQIEVDVKLLSIDPVKGDATARLEFAPHGDYAKDDGTLTRNLKLYVNSANAKQETD